MKITPIQYEREDGLVLLQLIRPGTLCPGGRWVIRKINGPTFFLDPDTKTWIVTHMLAPETQKRIMRPFEEAYRLFEVVVDPDMAPSRP